jgi:hypothetical protein
VMSVKGSLAERLGFDDWSLAVLRQVHYAAG